MSRDRRPDPERVHVVARDLGQTWFAELSGGRVEALRVAPESEPVAEGALVVGRLLSRAAPPGCVAIDVGLERPAIMRNDPHVASTTRTSGAARLVEIVHPGRDSKGARVSGRPRLAGWFAVLVPGGSGIRVSRRAGDDAARAALARRFAPAAVPGAGVILRSAARSAPVEAVVAEIRRLADEWASIEQAAGDGGAPVVVRPAAPPAVRFAQARGASDAVRLVVEDAATRDEIEGASTVPYADVSVHEGPLPLIEARGLERAGRRARATSLELPGGGRLSVRELEPLAVADIDAGADRRGPLAVNLEAADELARQLRLRNLGGPIVADFIDLARRGERARLDEALVSALAFDAHRVRALPLSAFGIVELTRRRRGLSLAEVVGARCPGCGATHVASDAERARELLRAARRALRPLPRGRVVVRAAEPVLAEARRIGERFGARSGLSLDTRLELREGDEGVEPA